MSRRSVPAIENPDVEVVQQQERDVVLGAHIVDERPGRCHRHALGRHDGEIELVGDPGRLKHRVETFFLDKQHRAEIAARPEGVELRLAKRRVHEFGIVLACEVIPHLKRADAEALAVVRFGEMTARVVDDVPVDVVFVKVIGQQGLCEIVVPQFPAGHLLNVRPSGVHDLPGVRGQRVVTAYFEIRLFHNLRGHFLERDAALLRHAGIPIRP